MLFSSSGDQNSIVRINMNYQQNNGPFGQNRGMFGSPRYQYQTLPSGYEGTQVSGLMSRVMGLLAFSFLFAAAGTFVGFLVPIVNPGTYWIIAIAGLVVLIILQFVIQIPRLNLFLLYLFTFLEGMSLSPLIAYYITNQSNVLGQAFLITAISSFGLAAYAWLTKRDFSRLGICLFFGSFFNTTLIQLIISFFGVALFSGYVIYYVQRGKNMADTMPNAIGLTISLFLTVLNLFLFILRILSIFQGNSRR